MQKILLPLCAALLLCAWPLKSEACKRSPVSQQADSLLVVIVMDSTQALLPNAVVKLGRQSIRTRADGKAILRREEGKISIACEGYKATKMPVTAESLMLVKLQADKSKKETSSGKDLYYTKGAVPGSRIYYSKEAKYETRMMVADGMAFEAAMSEESAPLTGLKAEPNNAVSAGRLTAGEVNDFARWEFWKKVLHDTHKQYISDWRLKAQERYTVQVTNRYGYPLVNRAVSLLDAKGNTLFQAVTDNTGKAELWCNLRTDKQQPTEGLQISVDGVARAVKGALTTVEIDEECDTSDEVDVFFIFDATGSMGDELRYLQAEMRDVIARAEAATGGLHIRTGAVVYRDFGDEYLTRLSRLTDDMKVTQTFIDQQEANGGGDFPEAVPEALMAALNSGGWSENARARIAFLILDAPCHTDSASVALMQEQILNAAAMGVRVVPVVCSGLQESGELLLRTVALTTNGTSFFLTDDSGIGNTHLKPTTDSLKVEHLNDMLVRTIVEFSYVPVCTGHWVQEQIEQVEEQFVPNPFEVSDLEKDETIPHGPTTLYLLDISGKLICIYNGVLEEAGDSQLSSLHLSLSTGIYFVKAFYDGEWHTKKILVH